MNLQKSFAPMILLLTASACGSNGMMGQRGMMTGPGAIPGADGTSITSVSPGGNATSVSTTTPIVIRFSHAMAAGMEQYVYLHQGEITGPVVPMSYAWSGDRATLTCTPAIPLQGHTRYTLHMGGGMLDANGHMIDLDDMPMMGGQWVMPGMFGSMPSYMMGPGWQGANGSYGMMLSFTTA